MESTIPHEATADASASGVWGALSLLAQALAGRGIAFLMDPARGAVTVGDYTIMVWATCCPYAVYGQEDWLPHWQFDSLPALLQFLHDARGRAA
jgi:hypothetical protein